jgi:glycosyltransferase involved in cell wall biosynthesis
MRILLLTREYPPDIGGIATAARGMALALNALGHQPFVVCPSSSFRSGLFEDEGVHLWRFPYQHRFGDVSFPYNDKRRIERYLPEVINKFYPEVIWSVWTNYSIALAQTTPQIPFLHMPPNALPAAFRGMLSGGVRLWYSPRVLANALLWLSARVNSAAWERQALMACRKTVVFSYNVKREFQQYYPDLVDKIAVVRPGCDPARFPPISRDLACESLCEWGHLPEGRLPILYVGRLAADKHLDKLFYAFDYLRDTSPMTFNRLHLLVVGEGPQEPALRRLAKRLHIPVTFCGSQVEHLGVFYSGAWCLVLPTLIESFGFVLLEAALYATPAIAFHPRPGVVQTAADEIIVNGETGLLASPATPEGLANAIITASAWNVKQRNTIGAAAQRRVINSFNWEQFVEVVTEF